MKNKKLILVSILSALWVSSAYAALPGDAYASNNVAKESVEAPKPFAEVLVQAHSGDSSKKGGLTFVRSATLQEMAISYGAQSGLAYSLKEYNDALLAKSESYDKSYNFSSVMLEPGFLPPVITEGVDAYNQTGQQIVRAADVIYRIESDARIVNVPPRWEEYLLLNVSGVAPLRQELMPTNSEETEFFDTWFKKGWDQGVQQAQGLFDANLARLDRDFLGMQRYKILYSQNMISRPLLVRSTLGTTGGDREMAVNDRIVEVTSNSKLNPDNSTWLYQYPAGLKK